MSTRKTMAAIAALMLLGSMITVAPAAVMATTAGITRHVPLAGTGSPTTGDHPDSGSGLALQDEFPSGDSEEGPDPYAGTISFSTGTGGSPSATGAKKAKSNPIFNFGFEGLNHFQQRYTRGGNQFSVEPPDQGMCAGNGDVVEVVNDVFNVYS